MTYAEKFPMLNKYKAFGLANVVGECGYAIFPCQLITCNECKFKSDVDSEFSLTCRGARTRWLMSACEDTALPKIIAEEDMEDVLHHIYPPTYSEPVKVEDEYGQEDEDTLADEKELIDALMIIKHHCLATKCPNCILASDYSECALINNPVPPEDWSIDTIRRIVL